MSTATLPTPPQVGLQAVARIPRSDLPPDQPPFAVYRFSIEQYHAMIEHGILDEVVNLPDEQVEVYCDPTGPSDAPRYQTLATYLRGDSVPLVLDGVEIAQIPVDDLLP